MLNAFDPNGKCGNCLLYGAISGLEDGLLLVDPEGRVFHLNRRAEEILGVEAPRALGRLLQNCVRHPELAAFWDSPERESHTLTTDISLPRGQSIQATLSGCFSAEGERIGTALLLRDVTKEKRVTLDLSRSVAQRLLDMTGGDNGEESETTNLTRREGEILRLLVAGLSNSEIAAKLNVTVNTVASHLKNLYPKLKVKSRSQAAAYAVSRGIRPPVH